MKKCVPSIASILLLCCVCSSLGCKRDSDVLAIYTGGTITRGEFHSWLDANNLKREVVLKNKKVQKAKIQMMAVLRLAAAAAVKDGFDNNEEFKVMAEMQNEGFLISTMYKRTMEKDGSFIEPAVKLRMISVPIGSFKMDKGVLVEITGKEREDEFMKATVKAEAVLARLKKGEAFADLEAELASDKSKKKNRGPAYKIWQSLPVEVAEAAFSLKNGEYSSKPIRTANSIVLILVEDKKIITPDNIGDIIADKGAAKQLSEQLKHNSGEYRIAQLKKAKDVSLSLDNAFSGDKNAVIFTVGGYVFRAADLKVRTDIIGARLKREHKTDIVMNDLQKRSVAEGILRYVLFKREAEKEGLLKDPKFLKESALRREYVLAREYLTRTSIESVKVEEKEIRDEYRRYQEMAQKHMKGPGAKMQKAVPPLSQVRDRIAGMIFMRRQSGFMNAWKQKALADSNFKIDELKLEGK